MVENPDRVPLQIVDAVADANEVETSELRPLADVIDPDAISQMFDATNETKTELQFEYEGYRVHIDTTRESPVILRPTNE